jgi:hypothetical protein
MDNFRLTMAKSKQSDCLSKFKPQLTHRLDRSFTGSARTSSRVFWANHALHKSYNQILGSAVGTAARAILAAVAKIRALVDHDGRIGGSPHFARATGPANAAKNHLRRKTVRNQRAA